MAKLKYIPVIALTPLLGACPRAPSPPRAQISSLPKLSTKPHDKQLLTYFAATAFETTAKLSEIPADKRGWVRVVDLRTKPQKRRDHELVYVADMRKAKPDGSFPYVVMSRRAFELAARNGAGGASEPESASSRPVSSRVILYATRWCPACKAARRYLTENKIDFVEKDIEKDPQAAAELMRKAKAAGISASGVPVLDVGGRLMQGFDPGQLNRMLAKGQAGSSR